MTLAFGGPGEAPGSQRAPVYTGAYKPKPVTSPPSPRWKCYCLHSGPVGSWFLIVKKTYKTLRVAWSPPRLCPRSRLGMVPPSLDPQLCYWLSDQGRNTQSAEPESCNLPWLPGSEGEGLASFSHTVGGKAWLPPDR